MFLILRIFAVSEYDWHTAFAVSTTLGLDDGLALVFGSLMSGRLVTSVLLALVLPLLLAAFLWGPREHRAVVVLLSTVASVTLVGLVVTFHSWWLPLATGAVLGAFALVRRLAPHGRVGRTTASILVRVVRVAGVAVLLGAAVVQTPWVPREQIETSDGTITGYVLSVDPGFLNVLTDDHDFVILPTSRVLSRE